VNERLTDPADILEAAADLLVSEGWCQGAFYRDEKGMAHGNLSEAVSFCAMGAIRMVSGVYNLDGEIGFDESRAAREARAVLHAGLNRPVPGLNRPVPAWNDEAGRTADEVVDAMRHAAKDFRNRREAA
jgi:hypothetical protein